MTDSDRFAAKQPTAGDIVAADAMLGEGNALEDNGDVVSALAVYRCAVSTFPHYARAQLNVGNALRKLGRADAAEWAYEAALDIDPDYVPGRFNLAALLLERAEFARAETQLRALLDIDPQLADVHVMLADLWEETERLDDAMHALESALAIDAAHVGAAFNLGRLKQRLNRLDDAEHWYNRARELDSIAYGDALSGYCFSLNLQSDIDSATVFAAHVRAGALISQAARGPSFDFGNDRNPDRRLAIGYVSCDFRQHPIALFMRPILTLHDRNAFAIHCYAASSSDDEATRMLRALVPNWHVIAAMDDATATALIRSHGIDVLIDLSGHTEGNRLGIFARRAAPVQATWLGYLNTTGLDAIDYRLCDGYAERDGVADALHTEQLHRLPHSQWCYAPWYDVAPIDTPHRDRPDDIVFGSFNQLQKITDASLDLWCSILTRLPEARLVVLDVDGERARRRLLGRLEKRGISSSRVIAHERKNVLDYFAAIGNVDVALDPVPYNGATTTFDALWMGTPLIALVGDRGTARGGYSILRSLPAPELIAKSPSEYVELNVRLARDINWRRELRASLRQRLAGSVLMDARRFTMDLEAAYREMWRRWCRSS